MITIQHRLIVGPFAITLRLRVLKTETPILPTRVVVMVFPLMGGGLVRLLLLKTVIKRFPVKLKPFPSCSRSG